MPHKVLTLTGSCRLGYLYHNSMFESDNFIQSLESLATVFLKTHSMHRPFFKVSPWRSKLGCWETGHKLSSHCQGGPRWHHTVMSVICLSSVAGHQDVIRMSRSQTNRPWNAWPWNLPQLGTKRSASKASKSSSSSSSTTTCRTCRLACTVWCLLHSESTSLLNQGVKEGSEGEWCVVCYLVPGVRWNDVYIWLTIFMRFKQKKMTHNGGNESNFANFATFASCLCFVLNTIWRAHWLEACHRLTAIPHLTEEM